MLLLFWGGGGGESQNYQTVLQMQAEESGAPSDFSRMSSIRVTMPV